MGLSAFPGFDYGPGQTKAHLQGDFFPIRMKQFAEKAMVSGLKISTILDGLVKSRHPGESRGPVVFK